MKAAGTSWPAVNDLRLPGIAHKITLQWNADSNCSSALPRSSPPQHDCLLQAASAWLVRPRRNHRRRDHLHHHGLHHGGESGDPLLRRHPCGPRHRGHHFDGGSGLPSDGPDRQSPHRSRTLHGGKCLHRLWPRGTRHRLGAASRRSLRQRCFVSHHHTARHSRLAGEFRACRIETQFRRRHRPVPGLHRPV
jgi:hypothetical protein